MAKVILKIKGKNHTAHLGMGFMEKAMLAENPEDGNILNINTWRLMLHALAYGAEREGKEFDMTIHDLHDWIDSKGLHNEEIKSAQNKFQLNFMKYMRIHTQDKEALKVMDKMIESLTPEERKKNG